MKRIDPELLKKTYQLCYTFSNNMVGPKKTAEFFHTSYQTILQYFHVLKKFTIDKNHQLQIEGTLISENELLSFSVWMQQFIKELKNFMVGLGRKDIEDVTAELQDQLQECGFYTYYHQAKELDY